MKCFFGFLLLFLTAVPWFSAAFGGESPETPAEMETIAIPNASFEELNTESTFPASWNGSEMNFKCDSTVAHSGKSSLRWENTDPKVYATSNVNLSNWFPGESYRLTGWMKTKDVAGNGARICVQWYGKNGKYIGGSYSLPLKGTRDWTEIHAAFCVPETAARLEITCFGEHESTGTVWFDDLKISSFERSAAILTTDHYRSQAVGGPVKLCAGIRFTEADVTPEQKSEIFLEIVRKSDSRTVQMLREFLWEDRDLTFHFDSTPLAPGKYALTLHLPSIRRGAAETVSLPFTRLEKYPERKVYFDEHQRAVVDGKPFFPLGLYFDEPTSEDLERLENSPFNCIMPYHRPDRAKLDEIQKHGLYALITLQTCYNGSGAKSDEEADRQVTEIVTRLKDHPAILGWYTNDELPLSMIETLTKRRDFMEQLDPSRPTWAVLWQVDELREYIPSFDAVGSDPYPVPVRPITMSYEWANKTHRAVFGCRPCWQVPQLFNKKNYPQNKGVGRTPTYEEMRGMIWMNLAAGADGIIAYSYFDLRQNFAEGDTSPEARRVSLDRCWKDVLPIAEEVKRYEKVFLSVEDPAELLPEAGSDPEIAVRNYALDGETWLMLVNTVRESKTVHFILPEGSEVKNSEDWTGTKVTLSETPDGTRLTVELDAVTPTFLQIGKRSD